MPRSTRRPASISERSRACASPGRPPALGSDHFEELPGALPRARLVANAVPSAEPSVQIEQIDVATTALVEDPVDLVAGPSGEVEIEEDLPGRIRIAARSQTRQLLILAESFHAGWKVTVDGEPRPVLRVYGDFMGCVVDAGRHVLRFRFEPRSYQIGRAVSLAALGGIIVRALCAAEASCT